MAHQDPFHLVRDEIQESANSLQVTYTRWDRLPPGNAERIAMVQELMSESESIMWQLEELERAITAAERDYNRFHIEPAELKRRRQWTSSTRDQTQQVMRAVQNAREEEERLAAAHAREEKARLGTSRARGGAEAALDNIYRHENDELIDNARTQQQQLFRQQDDDLDELSEGVRRLGQVGLTIGEELEEQGRMLDELDAEVDGGGEQAQGGAAQDEGGLQEERDEGAAVRHRHPVRHTRHTCRHRVQLMSGTSGARGGAAAGWNARE
eukprot:CAMPEP_0183796840 /NCGR_PEP_ID=MMETSP0803_2-20130417/13128_1 /TAXON_ID=195967 /ORGANISM="Crustomastix stigmata, Strain CCMP3273" /LENGTH=267 /DNA_ID=CAMNT_0026041499 /DNA_START=16 /DNA_END=815 /DNA_ORIENTATION=+